jgi:hypothetical protein
VTCGAVAVVLVTVVAPTGGPLALLDAHAEAGVGPGWTYRPNALEWLGIGLVRIDLVLAGPGLRPVASSVLCPARGDHRAVRATLVRVPG